MKSAILNQVTQCFQIRRWNVVVGLLTSACLVPLLLYTRLCGLPLMSQDYVEVEIATRQPWQFFVNSAYLEPCFYYRPGWRLFDHILFRLGMSGAAETVTATHCFSLVLFMLCSASVFGLIWSMNGRRDAWAATLGTFVFAAHPVMIAPVVWISARWALYACAVFLLAALYWELVLPHLRSKNLPCRLLLCIIGAFPVFAIPMVSETGTVGMGALGLAILCRSLAIGRAQGSRWHPFIECALILAPVPFAYFAMRLNAIGTMFGMVNDISHIPMWQKPGLWLLGIQQDLNILLGPFAIRWLDVETSRETRSVIAIALSGMAALLILASPFLWSKGRRFVASFPLPALLLLVFFLFQVKALWLLVKPPLYIAGYYRGYAYVLPVCAVAMAAGLWMGTLRSRGRTVFSILLLIWSGAAFCHTWRAGSLWIRGGEMLRYQERELKPWLTGLPENTWIYMEGYSDWIAAPYCQQAFVWDWTHRHILQSWAGKKLKIEVSTTDHPLPEPDEFFDGYILRTITDAATPVWERKRSKEQNTKTD